MWLENMMGLKHQHGKKNYKPFDMPNKDRFIGPLLRFLNLPGWLKDSAISIR